MIFILQTFIPKSNNKMHEEDSFFKQLLFKRIKITKVLFFFYKYGWDDVRSSSAGYSLKFAKRIVTKSGDG